MDHFIDLINKSAIEILAKTSSKKNRIIHTSKGFIVEIKAKPENNKANLEIERFLTKIVKKPIKIISGKTSKKKLVKIK